MHSSKQQLKQEQYYQDNPTQINTDSQQQDENYNGSQNLDTKENLHNEKKRRRFFNKQDQIFELNPQLKDGPLLQRSCTDIFCCYIFLMAVAVMILISVLGFVYGHPDRLIIPYDPSGRACGYDEGVEDARFIYLAVPYEGYLYRSVCVRECPNWQKGQSELETLDCVPNKEVTTCRQTKADDCDFPSQCESLRDKSVIIYNTTEYFGRLCLSNDENVIKHTKISEILEITKLQQYFADFFVARWTMIGTGFLAYLLGFLFCILMIFLPNVITWIGVVLYFVILILLGVFFLNKSQDIRDLRNDTNDPWASDILDTDSDNIRIVSYLFFISAVISFIGLICMFKQINLAIEIIKSSQQFVQETLEILAVPALTGLLMIGAWTHWTVIFMYIFSAGDIEGGQKKGPFSTVDWEENWRHLLWIWLFAGIWMYNGILCINQYIMASSTCIWYFSQPYYKARRPVLQSIYRCFRFHLGSLALGAALLPLINFIRIILAYVDKNIRSPSNQQKRQKEQQIDVDAQQQQEQDQEDEESSNTLFECCYTCFSCCIGSYECFIKYMNKSGFIYIALTGQSFYQSAKYAYNLIERNAGKYGTVIGTGQVFVFIGKCLISISTTFVCYMLLSYYEYYDDNLFSPLFPSLFCLIYSYMLGNLFMSVFGVSLDAIVQCACLDEELYQKDGQPAQHTPQFLLDFFLKYGKDNQSVNDLGEEMGDYEDDDDEIEDIQQQNQLNIAETQSIDQADNFQFQNQQQQQQSTWNQSQFNQQQQQQQQQSQFNNNNGNQISVYN